jgi:hypothetical protein
MIRNKRIPLKSIDPLSQNENEALKGYIDENLKDGTLTPSKYQGGANLFCKAEEQNA